MKICACCCQSLPHSSFSKKQWRYGDHQRRCISCITSTQGLKVPITESESREPECTITDKAELPSCLICMCEGPDSTGQPLRRDCSCRGDDSGFVHLSCIVEFAKQKSSQFNYNNNIINFRRPWELCPSCNHSYANELAVDLASEFKLWVKRTYPQDAVKNLEAMVLNLEALQNMATCLKPQQLKKARQIAGNILHLTAHIKESIPSFSQRAILDEAIAYASLGRLHLSEHTKESAKAAEVWFKKCLQANRLIGNRDGISLSETYIAISKDRYEENNQQSVVDGIHTVYNQRLKRFGQESPTTIQAAIDYASNLVLAGRIIEAQRLLSQFIPICTRVHGPLHKQTLKAESTLKICKIRYVMVNHHLRWRTFQALRYEEDCLVVKGPVSPRNITEEETLTVAANGCSIFYVENTPVLLFGLKKVKHLNGKVGEIRSRNEMTGRYEVHFEDKNLKPHMILRDNFRIVFDLPEIG